VAATGSIVDTPLAAVAALNAVAIPEAEAGYTFMVQILGNQATPLIFGSLALSATAIVGGLVAYETTTAAAAAARLG
jgi:hypothetical protein